MKVMNLSDKDSALKQAANYYRYNVIYTNLSNSQDAYEWYIKEYNKTFDDLINLGTCYKNKDDYVLCANVTKMKNEMPDLYNRCFGVYNGFDRYISREKSDVIFMLTACPSKGYMSESFYSLIKDVLNKYKDYVVITDFYIEEELEIFKKYFRPSTLNLDGLNYSRWSKGR